MSAAPRHAHASVGMAPEGRDSKHVTAKTCPRKRGTWHRAYMWPPRRAHASRLGTWHRASHVSGGTGGSRLRGMFHVAHDGLTRLACFTWNTRFDAPPLIRAVFSPRRPEATASDWRRTGDHRTSALPGAGADEGPRRGNRSRGKSPASADGGIPPLLVPIAWRSLLRSGPTLERWLSEWRPANVSPGQVITGTPIHSASRSSGRRCTETDPGPCRLRLYSASNSAMRWRAEKSSRPGRCPARRHRHKRDGGPRRLPALNFSTSRDPARGRRISAQARPPGG